MARSVVTRKRHVESRPKAKTGCLTCRIRRIKCDENKPFCRKCISTGRTCDGFESPFRNSTTQSINTALVGDTTPEVAHKSVWPISTEVASEDVDLLNHYFSTKTIFDVRLNCDEEARQILQASLTDTPVRHAITSLRALREDFEMSGDDTPPTRQPTLSYDYGLQQYCMALNGLGSNLSSLSSNALKSALLCCQIFICIEQTRCNFADMAQHIIRGLKIMHECRARPSFAATDKLVPANHDQLPLLDVFIIKLFSAPCKFVNSPAVADSSGTTFSGRVKPPHLQQMEPRDLRTIAPDMRTNLVRLSESTTHFLGKVAQVESVQTALRLVSEKTALLRSLDLWLTDLEQVQIEMETPNHEHITVGFMRFFHQILRVVLLGVLDSSSELDAELQTANDQLQSVANQVGGMVRAYRACTMNSRRSKAQ